MGEDPIYTPFTLADAFKALQSKREQWKREAQERELVTRYRREWEIATVESPFDKLLTYDDREFLRAIRVRVE